MQPVKASFDPATVPRQRLHLLQTVYGQSEQLFPDIVKKKLLGSDQGVAVASQGAVYVKVPQPVVHCMHGVLVGQRVTVVTVIGTDEQPQDLVTAAKGEEVKVSQPIQR